MVGEETNGESGFGTYHLRCVQVKGSKEARERRRQKLKLSSPIWQQIPTCGYFS